MKYTADKTKKFLFGYLILTFYYLGALAMIYAITYPPFKEVTQNFKQHAIVFERYSIWILYIPGVLMLLSAVALLFFRAAYLPKWAAIVSAFFCLISVATMFLCMIPLHHEWMSTGFDSVTFEQSKNITFAFQLVPSILQALIAVSFLYIYLQGVKLVTKIMFIALFVLCFFPMGTIMVECHLNYALWATVGSLDWIDYRRLATDMRVFASIFLIPFYFPIILLAFLSFKKQAGFSRNLIVISLIALLYVFAISAAYFVPDLQFELDKYHSQNLIQELIRNEIWMRTPVELMYWVTVASLFWKFTPNTDRLNQTA
jgi:hypothetical protein